MQRFVAGETLPSRVRACCPICASRRTPWPAPSPTRRGPAGLWLCGRARPVRDHADRAPTCTTRTTWSNSSCCCTTMAWNWSGHQPPAHPGALLVQRARPCGRPDMSAERRMLMRDVFDLPDSAAMDDGIANGTWEPSPARRSPVAVHRAARGLFAAPPAPLHRHLARAFQNFVLFTNYQFYIDEFVRLGHEEMANPTANTSPSSNPATWSPRRVGLSAEPGDELGARPAPAANARLPPGARRPQRHHHGSTSAWARPTPRTSPTTSPCCARTPGSCWATARACATASNWATTCWPTAMCREDHVLDEELPLWVPIPRWPRFSSP